MSFIDASYFVAELNIPNPGTQAVAQQINWFIQKYEPVFLQKLLGYPLYKAFVAGLNVTPPATPDQRFLNILYGAEYTDYQGYTQKWKGLIVTDSPVFNLAGGLTYKKPSYVTVGTTVGFTANATVAVLSGTGGTDDWRGWTPIITRTGVMKPGVDYSWDIATGTLTLLRPGDKFGAAEFFFVQFDVRTDSVLDTGITPKESCIANFIYYWYRRSNATQFTGVGELLATADQWTHANPRKKIASAWNQMHDWVKEFIYFMDSNAIYNPAVYPEWNDSFKIDALKYFGFINPFF